MKIAEDIGFNSRPLRGDIDDIPHLSFPAVLHWDLNHFVVITKITQGVKGKIYHIHDDIEAMPLAYETLVGDMGSVLSGGQMQRVLLARALYSDPDILFMDEGTANLDPATEEQILDIIAGLKCTRIMIAHRPKTLEVSDKVYAVVGGMLRPMVKSDDEQNNNIDTSKNKLN